MRIITLISFSALALCSCSAAWKLRRAHKMIAEAVAQGAEVRVDTVYRDHRVEVPGPSTTVTLPGATQYLTRYRDTTIYQDRIKIHYSVRRDTILQRIECPDSTIVVHEAAAINQQIICPPAGNLWKYVALTLAAVLILFLIFKR